MFYRSVVEKCVGVGEVVGEKGCSEKCWRRELEEKRCREVLEKRVVEMCCREVLEKGVVEKCWRRVLYRSVGEECWQHWCKRCLV